MTKSFRREITRDLVLVIIFVFHVIHSGHAARLIVVDGNRTTLQSVFDNIKDCTVVRLMGVVDHILSGDFYFDNVHNISVIGPESDFATISCNRSNGSHSGALIFNKSSNITLANIKIMNCGMKVSNSEINLSRPLKDQLFTLLFTNCTNVTLNYVIMTNNSGINLAGINLLGNSTLENVEIQNIASTTDTRLVSSAALFEFRSVDPALLQNASVSLRITKCCFINNTNTLPDEVLEHFRTYIISFVEDIDTPLLVPGLTVAFFQGHSYSVGVHISSTHFVSNSGRIGGGLFVAFTNPVDKYTVTVDRCSFHGNRVNKKYIQTSYGAGIIAISYFSHDYSGLQNMFESPRSVKHLLTITNSNFTNNSAVVGTCIYLYTFVNGTAVSVALENVTFEDNSGDVATALYVEDHLLYEKQSTVSVSMKNIVAQNNALVHATSLNSKPLSNVNGLFVFFNVKNVSLHGDENHFKNNTPGVLGLSRTHVMFSGTFSFVSNHSPRDGGAIYLTAGSTMVLDSTGSTDILFMDNHANRSGGAIFSDSSEGFAELAAVCPIQYDLNQAPPNVTFCNNGASFGGNSIFASQLYPCGWYPRFGSLPINTTVNEQYISNFTFSGSSKLEITSTANRVCLCHKGSVDYDLNANFTVFPGEAVDVSLIVVDKELSPIHSNVHFLPSGAVSPANVPTTVNCTNATLTLYGVPNKTGVNITLKPAVSLYTKGLVFIVTFTKCHVGFKHNESKCICDHILHEKGFCRNNKLTVPDGAWIGIIGKSLYFSTSCDVAFCKYGGNVTGYVDLHNNVSELCMPNHDGILCGKCRESHSVVFGSAKCRYCNNYTLLTLLGYAVVGILIVVLLSVLKLTVDKGIINGVIFYANLVYINHNLLYIEHIKVLPKVFDMLNLDPPTGICFYHGMTALVKFALELTFPVYLWLLVLVIVGVIKKFPKVSNIIQSPSKLLATLVYLSYSKLLLVFSYIVTPVEVTEISSSLANHIRYRWYYDPNVPYGESWHLVLVIVCLLAFFVLLLPFAVVLTFPNYCLGFRCIVRFKPIIDSYTAPYEDHWACWLGVHLLMLILFYIFITIPYINPRNMLVIMVVFLTILLSVQLYYKPYKSKVVNFLDSLFLLNFMFICCILLWIVKEEGGLAHDEAHGYGAIVYVFLTIAAIEILMIVFYHIILVTCPQKFSKLVKRICLVVCGKKTSILDDFSDQYSDGHSSSRFSEDDPLLANVQDGPPRFRESLLDYNNLIPRSNS